MRRLIKSSLHRTSEALKLLSIEAAIILVAFFGAMALVVFLIKQVFLEDTFALDGRMFDFFGQYVSPGNTKFFNFFTFFGSHRFLVPANLSVMAYAFFIMRNKWFGIKVTAVAFSSLFLMFGLKMFFNRQRPEIPLLGQVPGLSFPSGHALMSFAFFGLFIYVIYKQIKNIWLKYFLIALCLAMIVLISISRIYLRVHYFSDVMAGLCIGLMWVVISLSVIGYLEKRRKAKRGIPAEQPA